MSDRNDSGAAEEEAWFDIAFGAHYEDLYARRDAGAAEAEARFAAKALRLEAGDRVLDLACGPGHHLARFRALGLEALGLDRSPALVRRCAACGPAVRADMRRLPLGGVFDAVTTFFTTLGYFETDAENGAVFREIARALKPGGRFLLDHLNAGAVRRTLEPSSERVAGGRRVVECRWIEEDPARVCKRVEAEGIAPYTECVRLFEREELEAALSRAGLFPEGAFGNFRGGPFRPSSDRMILVARKRGPS